MMMMMDPEEEEEGHKTVASMMRKNAMLSAWPPREIKCSATQRQSQVWPLAST